ncbi:MAG: hypothetical protein HC842_07285 [Cytophagales bacterium]|nr:hypothetical protein [Cytophagales bacterium]
MKNYVKILLMGLGLLVGILANAQDTAPADSSQRVATRYLVQKRDCRISGFAGSIFELSGVNGKASVAYGGGAGAIFDERFFIGGFGLAQVQHNALELVGQEYQKVMGTGGLWMGYYFQPENLLHLGVDLKIGGGGIALVEAWDGTPRERNRDHEWTSVFMANPSLNLTLNVISWMKVSAYGGYRVVLGQDTEFIEVSQFNSPTAGMTFTFGYW